MLTLKMPRGWRSGLREGEGWDAARVEKWAAGGRRVGSEMTWIAEK
jgi:hypothetical protein